MDSEKWSQPTSEDTSGSQEKWSNADLILQEAQEKARSSGVRRKNEDPHYGDPEIVFETSVQGIVPESDGPRHLTRDEIVVKGIHPVSKEHESHNESQEAA
ncbi:MAG: hypothetical protein WC787_03825 [Patescibacteria group bacterium]|jgi:hypothetical protein